MQPGIFHESGEQEEYMSSRVQEASDDIKQPVKLKDLVQEQCPEFLNGRDLSDVYYSLKRKLEKMDKSGEATPRLLEPGMTREEVAEYVQKYCYKTVEAFCKRNGIKKSIIHQFVSAAKGLLDQWELINEINKEGWGFSKELQFNRDAFEDLIASIRYWRCAELNLLREKIVVEDPNVLKELLVPLYNIDQLANSLRSELIKN